jgi:hypothetical protein
VRREAAQGGRHTPLVIGGKLRRARVGELDAALIQPYRAQGWEAQALELMGPDPGRARGSGVELEADHIQLLPPPHAPGVGVALDVAPDLEGGDCRVPGVATANSRELALNPRPAVATLRSPGVRAEIAAQEP